MSGTGAIEVREASVADAAELAAVQRACDRERVPDRPPIGATEIGLELFRTPDRKPRRIWLATLDGQPAGYLDARLPMIENLDQVEIQTWIAPAHRRLGVASALLAAACDAPDGIGDDRTTVNAVTSAGPGTTWCERLGMQDRQTVRESRLRLWDCDIDEVRTWVAPAGAVAAGYWIVSWHGPYPEERLDEICVALASMADAPMDDVEHAFTPPTHELARDGARSVRGRIDAFGSLALTADGRAAGFTELGVLVHRPTLGVQGDTVVVGEHRGHRLGWWLKATSLLQVLAVHPDLADVITDNAESNPWMLAINEAMGYRPTVALTLFQGNRDDAVAHIRGRRRGEPGDVASRT